jgi:hypothetical protein
MRSPTIHNFFLILFASTEDFVGCNNDKSRNLFFLERHSYNYIAVTEPVKYERNLKSLIFRNSHIQICNMTRAEPLYNHLLTLMFRLSSVSTRSISIKNYSTVLRKRDLVQIVCH